MNSTQRNRSKKATVKQDSELLKYRIDEWVTLKFGDGIKRKKALISICENWGMSFFTLLRYRRAKISEHRLNLSYQRLKWLQNYLDLPSVDDLVTRQ